MKIVKKVSVKSVCGTPKRPTETDPERPLCIIMGRIDSAAPKTTDLGESIKFSGHFRARDLSTGQEAMGGECYLPKIIEEMTYRAFQHQQGLPLEFAFQFGVKFSSKSVAGYEYTCHPLIESGATDPLEALVARVNQALLPSPTTALEPAPETKGKKK